MEDHDPGFAQKWEEAPLSGSRIAVFLHCLGGGGAERISLNLAAGMAARNLPVDLVLVQGTGAHLRRVPPSVRLVNFQSRRHLTSLLPLIRYLRQERPRVLLSALTHTNLYALAARRLAGSDTRVVIRINNTITEELRAASGIVARLIRPAGARFLYREADGIVAVSEGAADGLRAAFGEFAAPVQVIPNPVVIPALFEQAREPLEHPWFAEGEPPVLLAVGRLVAQKDIATLIRGFALVRRQIRARLLVLGEGDERPQLEQLIADHGLRDDVRLPGFVTNPYPYMAAARGVVLSSRYEGSPSVLVEALALGTPVASTDCPSGPREILQQGRWGRLVAVGDSVALADAMLEILHGSPCRLPGPEDLVQYQLDHAVDRYLAVMDLGDRVPVPTP